MHGELGNMFSLPETMAQEMLSRKKEMCGIKAAYRIETRHVITDSQLCNENVIYSTMCLCFKTLR